MLYLHAFLSASLVFAGAHAQAQDSPAAPVPGTYTCRAFSEFGTQSLSASAQETCREAIAAGKLKDIDSSTSAAKVKGYCVYQSRPLGPNAFSRLLSNAHDQAMNFEDFAREIEPKSPPGTTQIKWWFNGMANNICMGEYLKEVDVQPNPGNTTQIDVTVTVHSFERGRERDIGLKFGGFLGKKSEDAEYEKATTSFAGKLFNAFFRLGNPFASFLDMSIRAVSERREGASVQSLSFFCENDGACESSNLANNVLQTVVGNEKEEVGLHPKMNNIRIKNAATGEIEIRGLSIHYGSLTGSKDMPVETYEPISGSGTFTFQADEIQFIGALRRDSVASTKQPLERAKQSFHEQIIVTLKASVREPGRPARGVQQLLVERDYKPGELAAQLRVHPELQAASLEESLRSVEAQCYTDPSDVSLSAKICGFRFTKIMPGTERLPLRFKVEGKLKDGESSTRDWRLGAVFQEKGMYQLPQLAEQDYVLSIDLVSVGALKAQVAREAVTGVRIPFSYLEGLGENPIVFGSDQILSVKQGDAGVVVTRGADAKTKKKKRFGIF